MINAHASKQFPGWEITNLGGFDRAYTSAGPCWVATGRASWDGPDAGRKWARVMGPEGEPESPVLYGYEAVHEAIRLADTMNGADR